MSLRRKASCLLLFLCTKASNFKKTAHTNTVLGLIGVCMKTKRIILFLIISIITIVILISIPFNLFFTDSIILTEDEFNKLMSSNSFIFDKIVEQCSTSEVDDKLNEYAIKYKLFNLFNIKNLKVSVINNEVYAGGKALGFVVNTRGLIVVGCNYILTREGRVCPMESTTLEVGDVIIAINGKDIVTMDDMLNIVNSSNGEAIELTYVRSGNTSITSITPVFDIQTNSFKLGLWLKEDAMGVGTITYVDTDANYGALGHAISLDNTGTPLDITGGSVYDCNVVGVKIGSVGQAGQLLGAFNVGDNSIGTLNKNTENGAFGTIFNIADYTQDMKLMKVGGTNTVKPGKAKILSCVSGTTVKEYDIDIIKTNYQGRSNNRSMVIKITDPELLRTTGGIVQGMSGSPIIQDGKLVGAVTHVFLNDATKGFGLFIDWMI